MNSETERPSTIIGTRWVKRTNRHRVAVIQRTEWRDNEYCIVIRYEDGAYDCRYDALHFCKAFEPAD